MNEIFLFFVFMFGLIIGSFLNCVIWRLHIKENLFGRSHCPHCHKKISWYDNIPLLSFIILQGHCRCCQKTISWRYPLVEFFTAILFTLIFFKALSAHGTIEFWESTAWLILVRDWLFAATLIVVFVTDALWYLIFDELVLPVVIVLGALNVIIGFSWHNMLLSATIGSGFFIIQFLVSRGRWIGGGDIRLGLLLGVTLGWPLVLPSIFIAYVIGAVVGLGLLSFRKKQWKSVLPLGTFLAISGIITLLYGEELIEWYLRLI